MKTIAIILGAIIVGLLVIPLMVGLITVMVAIPWFTVRQAPVVTGLSAPATVVLTPPLQPIPDSAAPSGDVILFWQSSEPEGDGGPAACRRLFITADQQAQVGPCTGPLTTKPFRAPQWDEIVERFASFEYRPTNTVLVFHGRGQVAGGAWERALEAWAESTYGELTSPRGCSACRTVLAWSLGEEKEVPGSCRQLVVTSYAYAYEYRVPCQGGPSEVMAQGWLETAELEQLERWMITYGPVQLNGEGARYLLGKGTLTMNPGEVEQVAQWAQFIALRLENNPL